MSSINVFDDTVEITGHGTLAAGTSF